MAGHILFIAVVYLVLQIILAHAPLKCPHKYPPNFFADISRVLRQNNRVASAPLTMLEIKGPCSPYAGYGICAHGHIAAVGREKCMQRIPLNSAQPGMVLAEPLLYKNGMTLAGAGFELTGAAIERFRLAGVAVVAVEGGDAGRYVELERIASKLTFLFRRQTGNAFMMGLQGILAKHYAEKMAALNAAEEEARLAKQALAQAAVETAKASSGRGKE